MERESEKLPGTVIAGALGSIGIPSGFERKNHWFHPNPLGLHRCRVSVVLPGMLDVTAVIMTSRCILRLNMSLLGLRYSEWVVPDLNRLPSKYDYGARTHVLAPFSMNFGAHGNFGC